MTDDPATEPATDPLLVMFVLNTLFLGFLVGATALVPKCIGLTSSDFFCISASDDCLLFFATADVVVWLAVTGASLGRITRDTWNGLFSRLMPE